MTLTDTGPLVSNIDVQDTHYQKVGAIINRVPRPLLTTEACLTEALYLLHEVAGWRGQSALLQMVNIGALQILTPAADGPARAYAYMERFRDQPCDYADATLLIAAEDLGLRSVFTLDRHFYAYRLTDGTALNVI